jgi:ankyrin repeat protein
MRPIHLAASEGLDRICALFLRQRVECKLVRDRHGREPMHWAAIAGSISTIKTLYDGACFAKNAVDELGFTALHYAAISSAATDIIPFLVRIAGFDIAQGVTEQSREDHTTAGGHIYAIRAMCCTGDTALHVAVKAGSAVACKRLVNLKANVRAVNSVGRTPLHDAVAVKGLWSQNESDGGPASTFKLLISAGAPVHAVDADGKTALHVAAAFNTVYALAYFMEHTSMDVSARDLKGKTALLIAVKYGNLEAVKVLQGVKPSVLDDVDFEGNSALHIAVQLKDDQEMIQSFDLQCLNTELRNKAGKTAEELAVEAGKSGLAEKLREYAKIHEKMALDAIRAQTEMQDGALKIEEFYKKASDDKSPTNDAQELPPLKSGMFAHFAHDQSLQSFVEQFSTRTSPRLPEKSSRASPNSSALAKLSVQTRGLDQADSKWDSVTMIKDFLDRFASRFNFDRCTSWKRKRHGLDLPLAKATMGYEDMITLLETLGLMDELVARPEVYKLFWTRAPGQSKASPKEITFSAFRSHMQHLATKAPPEMIQRFLSQPEEFQIEDDLGASSRYSSSEEDEMDWSSSNSSHLQRSHIDRTDYIPTITGVNGPSRGSSRGLTSRDLSSTSMSRGTSRGLLSRDLSSTSMSRGTSRGSELRPERTGASSCESPAMRTRTQSPDLLFDAFRDFSLSSPDKVRVDMDAGAVKQPSWASGGGMQFCKNKLHDLKELSRDKADLHQSMDEKKVGRGLRSSSRLSTGVSTGSGTSLFQPPPNSLIWKPMGCSRSGKVIQLLEQRGENFSSISDLSHYLKPIWIEFSPPVAPMPQLIDGEHEATYAVCFEMGDYVGCFEVIQSSLHHTSRDQVHMLVQRKQPDCTSRKDHAEYWVWNLLRKSAYALTLHAQH